MPNMHTERTKNPLVSVIIPTFNDRKWIPEAIQSISVPAGVSVEIIVVNDGSDDGTEDILKSFRENNQIRYFFQENRGPWVARNRGAEEADGKYLAFLDADDRWKDEKLWHQVDMMQSFSSLGTVITDVEKIDREGNRLGYLRPHLPRNSEDLIRDLYVGNISGVTSTILMRKQLFEKIGGFDVDLNRRADHLMMMKAARESGFRKIKQPLVQKRVLEGSTGDVLTKENPERAIRSQKPFIEKSVTLFPFLRSYRDKLLGEAYQNAAVLAFRANRRESCKQYIKKARANGPVKLITLFLYILVHIPLPPEYLLKIKRLLVGRFSSPLKS